MSRVSSVGSLSGLSLQLLRGMKEATQAVDQSTQRLSTLRKLNRASDNPSGMVAASRLQSQLDTINAAQSNVTRAQALVNTADTAASDVVSKLETMRTLALEVAGGTLSAAEKGANQAEINDLLDAIDRTARTSFNGTRLLDGTSGYTLSGVDNTNLKDVDVLAKRTDSDVTVNMNVTTTALKGAKAYAGGALGAATTLTVTGSAGTTTLQLANGATTQDITDAFNAATYLTGVTATRVDATNIDFATVNYGSAATIAITATAGTFTTTGTGTGRDAIATVNNTSFTAAGTAFNVNLPNLSMQIDIAPTASGALTAFTVSGTGLKFQTSTDTSDAARLGLMNLSTAALGGATGKLSTLRSGQANAVDTGNAITAIQVIDDALSEARSAQATIGSFGKYTLDTAESLLGAAEENTTAAWSDLVETDVPSETARLSQLRVVQEAALQALQVHTLRQADSLSLLQALALR